MLFRVIVHIGLVVRVDDDVTGFDDGKEGRPYLVVRVIGDPPNVVYVVPRTSTGLEGVVVPKGILRGLDKDGNFLTEPLPVHPTDLEEVPELGDLPEPYLSRVLARINTFYMELDE